MLPTQLCARWILGPCGDLAAWQFWRGLSLHRRMIGIVSAAFVCAFLVWAARGTSFSLIGILTASLQLATPILLGALSGILCERAGVVNIAIEGMMLMAAFTSVIVANMTGSIWLGLVAALLSGAFLAAWHGVPLHPLQGEPDHQRHGHQHLRHRLHQLPEPARPAGLPGAEPEQTFPVISNVVPGLGQIPIIGPLLL